MTLTHVNNEGNSICGLAEPCVPIMADTDALGTQSVVSSRGFFLERCFGMIFLPEIIVPFKCWGKKNLQEPTPFMEISRRFLHA